MTVDANSPSGLAGLQARGATAIERGRAAALRIWAYGRRHLILSGAVVAVIGAGLGYLVFAGGASGPGYVTATVTRGDIQDTVTALGNLQPRDYVDVGAQVSGQLKKLYVDIGDRVKEGQLVAEIDPRVLNSKVETDKSNLANLKAQLSDKRAQLALAQANFSRQERLMKAEATSRSDYDSALQSLRSARAQNTALQAQIAAAQSQLDGDQVTLGYTKIYAPMDGTVVSVSAKQGQTLNANQQAPTLMRIADLSIMTVWTQVSEADVPKLRIGMPAYFTTLGEPGKRWTGTLTQIQPTPDVVNNVVLYTATFDVKNSQHQLMTQMTAQVFFVTASAKDVLVVPVAALHEAHSGASQTAAPEAQGTGETADANRTGHRRHHAGADSTHRQNFTAVRSAVKSNKGAKLYWVRTVGADGSILRKPVAIGVSNRVSAQVIAGLNAGDRVITGTQQPAGETASSDDNTSRRHSHFGGPRL